MSEFKSLDSAGISYLWKKIAQAIDGGGGGCQGSA